MQVLDQTSVNATASSSEAEPTRRTWKVSRESLVVRGAQILLGLAWLGLWQLTAEHEWLDPVLAKTPGQSWEYLVTAAKSGELWTNTRYTMVAVLIAWIVAGAIGVVFGVALGLLPRVERVLTPYLDAANAMPRIALAPLFIVALGINTSAKVALASTLVFFIVMSGARAGVRSTDAEWLRLSTVLGATKSQMFLKVLIPVATPAIFAALRLGLIYSLLGVVGSELISARNGLGQLVATYSATFRMEAVYAILLFLALIAVLLNQAMSHAERWFLRWQPPVDR
ncbi:ABC transporter permease [Rhodococcus wratislaviensis]|uniref:Putative ABC transporter permease protein n=1 Tax=Rhodococcus wratislaviensis NBRC 100605 TaxID=1219028 RepID=X0R6W7_RHOWR|nr:ABC transporter permease [Rhodococcus wratislaviensis]GAF46705.1 putative ABC transporter permease protein [Rhodococcus wratislaviensis NBRC 100605]